MPTTLVRTFRVTFDLARDPSAQSAAWSVSVPSVRGCHSWGRSLAEARRNIREALAASLDDEDRDAIAAAAVFEEEITLPREARAAVQRFERLRDEAARVRADSAEAVRTLNGMLSLRDVGDLVGLSQEGVRKLMKAG